MAINFSSKQMNHAIKALQAIPGGVERAAVPALNRANQSARAEGLRKLTETYTAKRADIVKTLRMTKATRTSLVSGFSSKSPRMPLTAFSVSPRKPTVRGEKVRVSVRRDSGSKTISRGFLNKGTSSGRLQVLQREGLSRYPIQTLFGPSPAQMLNEEGVRESVEKRASEVLERRFDHEIGRLLRSKLK